MEGWGKEEYRRQETGGKRKEYNGILEEWMRKKKRQYRGRPRRQPMGFTAFNPSYRVETMKTSFWNPCCKMLWVPSLRISRIAFSILSTGIGKFFEAMVNATCIRFTKMRSQIATSCT